MSGCNERETASRRPASGGAAGPGRRRGRTGTSDQLFWFSPGFGLIGLQQDGVAHLRTDL